MATAGNVGGLLLGLLAGLGQAMQQRRLEGQQGQLQQMALLKDSGEFLPATSAESAQAQAGLGLWDRFRGATPPGFFNVGDQLMRFAPAQPLSLDVARPLGLTSMVPREVAGPSPYQQILQSAAPGTAPFPVPEMGTPAFTQPTTQTVIEEQVAPGLGTFTGKQRQALVQKMVEARLARQQHMISGDRLAEINPMFAPLRGRMIEEKLLPLLQEELKDQRKRGAFDAAQKVLDGGGSVQEAAKVMANGGVSDALINNFLGPQLKAAEQRALIPVEVEKQKALIPGQVEREVQQFKATFPERLDLARQQGAAGATMRPLEVGERQRLTTLDLAADVITKLRTEFTPEERARYVGLLGIRKGMQNIGEFLSDLAGKSGDPKFARFSALLSEAAKEGFGEGGKNFTVTERDIVFGFIPTGEEASTTQFEAKLFRSGERIPGLLDREIKLSTMPRGEAVKILQQGQRELRTPSTPPGAAPTPAHLQRMQQVLDAKQITTKAQFLASVRKSGLDPQHPQIQGLIRSYGLK